MDPQHVPQRDACFDSIKKSVTANDINRLTVIMYQNLPRVVLSALRLRKVEGGRNLVMYAVAMKRFEMVSAMMDMLERGVTAFNYWTSDEYAAYLSSLDDDNNNLLQLSIIYGEKNSDMIQERVITKIKTHSQTSLQDLVNNKNKANKNSIVLAVDHELEIGFILKLLEYGGSHEQNGRMRAVIFINKEYDNELNAIALNDSLLKRGFYVKHLNHTEWNSTTLCKKLGKCIDGDFHHLWVIGLTHGCPLHIKDHKGDRIKIEDVVRTVKKAKAIYPIIIIDVCQGNGSDDNYTADTEVEGAADELLANQNNTPAHEGDVPLGEPNLLVTSSEGEEAWGDVFVSPLVKYLNSGETDVYKILQLATEEAEEKSATKVNLSEADPEKRRGPQTVQFPPNLAEDDIKLPNTTHKDQDASA